MLIVLDGLVLDEFRAKRQDSHPLGRRVHAAFTGAWQNVFVTVESQALACLRQAPHAASEYRIEIWDLEGIRQRNLDRMEERQAERRKIARLVLDRLAKEGWATQGRALAVEIGGKEFEAT